MPPRRGNTDHNHYAIARALREVGCLVIDVHTATGALDLLCGYRGVWRLLEAKNLQGRGRSLTPAEQVTIQEAERVGAPVHIVTSVEEALRAIGAIK